MPIDNNLPKNEKKKKDLQKDNAVIALGKILKYHESELGIDAENILDIWINNMPITKDEDEGKVNNQFFIGYFDERPKENAWKWK